jgi:hypothetical protein
MRKELWIFGGCFGTNLDLLRIERIDAFASFPSGVTVGKVVSYFV